MTRCRGASAPMVARTSPTARTGEGRPTAGRRDGAPRGMSGAAAVTSARPPMVGHDIRVIAGCRFCETHLWPTVFVLLRALLPCPVTDGRRLSTPFPSSPAAPDCRIGPKWVDGKIEYKHTKREAGVLVRADGHHGTGTADRVTECARESREERACRSASMAEQLVLSRPTRAAAVDSRVSAATGESDARDILPHIGRRPPACQVLAQAATEAETQQPAGRGRGRRPHAAA